MKKKTGQQDPNPWTVYLLKCSDGSLYCGCTNDLQRRITSHNDGKGAKYTKGRLPVKLVAAKSGLNKSEAHRLEYQLKQIGKGKKLSFLKDYSAANSI